MGLTHHEKKRPGLIPFLYRNHCHETSLISSENNIVSQFIKKKKEKQISTFVEEQPLHGLDLPIPQQDCATQRVVQNQQEGQHGICAEIHERVALDSVKPEVQHDKVAVATAAAASPTCREWPRDLHPCEGVVGQVHLLQ